MISLIPFFCVQKYSEAFLHSSGCCFLGDDDAAVGLLVTHFQEVIPAIVAGTWKQSMIGLPLRELERLTGIKPVRKQRRKKRTTSTDDEAKEDEKKPAKKSDFKWTLSDLKEDKLIFDSNPHSFFTISASRLRVLYDEVLYKFAKSLRNYNYRNVTPHITATFGPKYVGVQDSGIGSLFPVRGPGRPPKRSLEQDTSGLIKKPLIRPPRLQSSDYPDNLIAHIHLIARDTKDEQLYVFVFNLLVHGLSSHR